MLLKKLLQTERSHQAFQLVLLLKKLKSILCVFAFCNLFSLANPFGGISCYLIPYCKIFLVHSPHIKLP